MSKWYELDENGYVSKLIIEPTENKFEVGMEFRMKGNQYIVSYVNPLESKNGKVKQEIGLSLKVLNCPDCGYEIKDKNKPCPNCGRKLTYEDLHYGHTPTKKRLKILLAFIAAIILFLIGIARGSIISILTGILSLIYGLLSYMDYIEYW